MWERIWWILGHMIAMLFEVKDYYPIVYDLINGDIDVVDLIDIARGNGTLENTMLLTALGSSNAETIILE